MSFQKESIGVVGLGYVGWPLAKLFAEAGHEVRGFDVSKTRIQELKTVLTSSQSILRPTVDNQETALEECEVYIIAVPTPLDEVGNPDHTMVEAAAETVLRNLNPDLTPLIVLESSVAPGTTQRVFSDSASNLGLAVDKDFFLAYSPERVDPGNSTWPVEVIPKVIAGHSEKSLSQASMIYANVFSNLIPANSILEAEFSKLFENTFRQVNISLVNEIASLLDGTEISIEEELRLAGTKPFGFMQFLPSLGIGGHCIPIDPIFMNSWLEQSQSRSSELIKVAQKVDAARTRKVVGDFVDRSLDANRLELGASPVLVVGVSYKPGSKDLRESASLKACEMLLNDGLDVVFWDPNVLEPSLLDGRLPRWDGASKVLSALVAHGLTNEVRAVLENQGVLIYDANWGRQFTRGI